MRAACRFIRGVHHLTILENGDACRATTNIDNRAVFDLQHVICRSRLIDYLPASLRRHLRDPFVQRALA